MLQKHTILYVDDEKENIMSQFEILKNQVNPHFLFNSMNVLSSLIKENPDKAISFTNNFSKVYRTLLQLKDQPVIVLDEELDLVKSYVDLQQVRFQDALVVDIDLEENSTKYVIPPFTLQLVLENAIKHNIVSTKKPLNISIHLKN